MPMVPIDRNTTSDAIRHQLLDMITEQYEEGIYKLPPEQQIADRLAVCVNLQEMIDFSMIIKRCGHSPSHDIYSLEEMPAGDIAAEKLHIADDAPVLYGILVIRRRDSGNRCRGMVWQGSVL